MARQIFRCTDDAVAKCAFLVKNEGVVVFPTDTVYGIGCDPFSDRAVDRLFSIKRRDLSKPLPVLAYSMGYSEKIVLLGSTGTNLAKRYWPGALTIVAPIADGRISSRVTAGGASLAIRVPANNCALSLLNRCGYLVGTSANLSGCRPPKNAQEVLDSSLDGFDALLDGGPVGNGVESTIIDITARPRIVREGSIKASEVLEFLERI